MFPCPSVSWSEWKEFSPCIATCGSGEKVLRRTCSVPGECDGDSEKIIKCQLPACEGITLVFFFGKEFNKTDKYYILITVNCKMKFANIVQ